MLSNPRFSQVSNGINKPQSSNRTLALYYYPSCFFCRRVLDALPKLGVKVELRNIHDDPTWLHELVEARGRRTVPVLRIENEEGSVDWMPESQDILSYLGKLAVEETSG